MRTVRTVAPRCVPSRIRGGFGEKLPFSGFNAMLGWWCERNVAGDR
jgi:hypothetical protein